MKSPVFSKKPPFDIIGKIDRDMEEQEDLQFPVCHCGEPLDKVRYLDYGGVRVAYHDSPGRCVIGTLNA